MNELRRWDGGSKMAIRGRKQCDLYKSKIFLREIQDGNGDRATDFVRT
jgi:hypothetical protein